MSPPTLDDLLHPGSAAVLLEAPLGIGPQLRGNHPPGHRGDIGVPERAGQADQPVAMGDRVIVRVGHEAVARLLPATVPRVVEARARLQVIAATGRLGDGPRLGRARRVVDDDHLVGGIRLPGQRRQARLQERRTVARADDHRDGRHEPCCLTSVDHRWLLSFMS